MLAATLAGLKAYVAAGGVFLCGTAATAIIWAVARRTHAARQKTSDGTVATVLRWSVLAVAVFLLLAVVFRGCLVRYG